MTGPIQIEVGEHLGELERIPSPLWDTFCGVSGGAWQGRTAAFSPYTGVACEAPPLCGETHLY